MPKPPTTPTPRELAARARFEAAVLIVERAQHDLEAACRMLCPIQGQIPAWDRLCKETVRVRALWDYLAYKRRGVKMSLDHEPDAESAQEVGRALQPESST